MIDTNRLKQEHDARVIIGKYTTLTPQGRSGYHAGPCPWCGGEDRLVVRADGWFCREGDGHCGRKGDVIRFIMERERLDFAGAVAFLVNQCDPTVAATLPAAKPSKPFDVGQWSHNIAHTTSALTMDSPQGRYLLGRGLQPETWAKFLVGAGYYPMRGVKHDSVIVPWHDQGGALVAVAHRLLNPPCYGQRYMFVGGKIGQLWGWRSHNGRYEVLYIVEGEINAMSIYQLRGVDVLSTGSQNARITPEQAAIINQWQTVKLWADNPTVAEGWRAVIGRGEIIRSDRDANQWLQHCGK